jgi:membrane protein involved in colicin uptake
MGSSLAGIGMMAPGMLGGPGAYPGATGYPANNSAAYAAEEAAAAAAAEEEAAAAAAAEEEAAAAAEGEVELVNTNGNGVPNSVASDEEETGEDPEEVNANGNGVPDAPVCKTEWDTNVPIKQQFKDLLSFRGCFANPRVA